MSANPDLYSTVSGVTQKRFTDVFFAIIFNVLLFVLKMFVSNGNIKIFRLFVGPEGDGSIFDHSTPRILQ